MGRQALPAPGVDEFPDVRIAERLQHGHLAQMAEFFAVGNALLVHGEAYRARSALAELFF